MGKYNHPVYQYSMSKTFYYWNWNKQTWTRYEKLIQHTNEVIRVRNIPLSSKFSLLTFLIIPIFPCKFSFYEHIEAAVHPDSFINDICSISVHKSVEGAQVPPVLVLQSDERRFDRRITHQSGSASLANHTWSSSRGCRHLRMIRARTPASSGSMHSAIAGKSKIFLSLFGDFRIGSILVF